MYTCMIYFKGHRWELPNQAYDMCLSLKIVLTSVKSVDPDEMPRIAAFHLGLHFLSKSPFRGFQNTKG